MKRTAFDESRDQRIANDTGVSQALMCTANGCPNRWSVDAGNGHLCSAHAWSDRHLWPQITQEQLDAETDRALAAAAGRAPAQPSRLSRAEKLAALKRIAGSFRAGEGLNLGWAHALKAREERGEQLSQAQRDMWRAALRFTASENRSEPQQEWRDAA